MKKAFPANINGKIFYIDEDAYNLLNDYLIQLRSAFPGEEGEEIVADIESRIREIFEETIEGGRVIVIDDVNSVIERMGRPEQLWPESDGSSRGGAEGATEPSAGEPTPPPYQGVARKRLYRNERNRVFGGVLSGLGQYMGWSVTALRILAVIVAFCSYFVPCVIVYLIAWLLIPAARSPREILEMQGAPVTVSAVGQRVMESDIEASGFIGDVARIIGVSVMGLFGGCAALTALVCTIVALCVMAGMVCVYFGTAPVVLDSFELPVEIHYLGGWGLTLTFFAVALPMAVFAWAVCSVVFNTSRPSSRALIAALVVEVVLIIGAAVMWSLSKSVVLAECASLSLMMLPVGVVTTPVC
ncbi:MAG: PspC domain-containing protein [Duncaniella sp.]|nr:PspC domain-containing protein [Duncaniella sp.]